MPASTILSAPTEGHDGPDARIVQVADILDWFKRQGPRYHARMNAALPAFVEAHRQRAK
jgi:uncharacterized protein (DUF4415 family)